MLGLARGRGRRLGAEAEAEAGAEGTCKQMRTASVVAYLTGQPGGAASGHK